MYADGFNQTKLQVKSFEVSFGSRFLDIHNSVFKIVPSLDFKYEQRVLNELIPQKKYYNDSDQEDELDNVNENHILKENGVINNEDIQEMKNQVQNLQINLDGELNNNMALYNKLKGTEILFQTSNFHLVHTASLKFLSIDDENPEQIKMKLVDFPSENCLFKFLPCLKFQKERTNIVYDQDVINICSAKQILNRKPYIYTSYSGHKILNPIQEEIKVIGNIETPKRWIVNLYSNGQMEESQKQINIGDSIWLKLSERPYCLSGTLQQNPFSQLLESVLNNRPLNLDFRKSFKKSMLAPNTTLKQNTGQIESNYLEVSKEQINDQSVNKNNQKIQYEELQSRENLNNFQNIDEQEAEEKSQNQEDDENLDQIQIDYIYNQLNDVHIQYTKSSSNFNTENQIPDTNGLWKIEGEKIEQGGFLQWEQNYRLKHFSTGKYLSVKQQNNKYILYLAETDCKDIKNGNLLNDGKESLFRFLPYKQGEQGPKSPFITKDTFYRLINVKYNLFLGFKDETLEQHQLFEKNTHQQQFPTLDDKETHINIFKMQVADFEDTWETNYLLYQIPIFIGALRAIDLNQKAFNQDFLQPNKYYTLRNQTYQIYQTLNDLEDFICNTLNSNISLSQDYGLPNYIRQAIIREQHVFGLLIWILYKAFPSIDEIVNNQGEIQEYIQNLKENNFKIKQTLYYNNKGLHSYQRARLEFLQSKYGICWRIYNLLDKICYENRQNQEYLFEYISLISPHIGYGDFVADSLIRSFQKNEDILKRFNTKKITYNQREQFSGIKGEEFDYPFQYNSFYNQDNVKNYQLQQFQKQELTFMQFLIKKFEDFLEFSKQDILKILCMTCRCLDKSIFINQDIIFQEIKNGTEFTKKACRKIKKPRIDDNKEVSLDIEVFENGQQKFIPLRHFVGQNFEISDEDFKRDLMYFKNQLILYANLCMDKNYMPCQAFQELFPLEFLVNQILDQSQYQNLRACYAQLVTNIYINTEKRQIVQYPNLVRTLQDKKKIAPDLKLIASTKKIGQRLKQQEQRSQNKENTEILDTQNNNDDVQYQQANGGDSEFTLLQKLKKEFLQLLKQKYDICNSTRVSFNKGAIYNHLTYEAIKIILTMIKTGIFHQNQEQQNKASQYKNLLKMENENEVQEDTDIDVLVRYLTAILEYDRTYYNGLKKNNIKFKYQGDNQMTNQKKLTNFLKSGITGVGQGLTSITNIITDKKMQKKKKKLQSQENGNNLGFEEERITNPFFKKVTGLKKIIQKYSNKTYTIREENTYEYYYEVEIKKLICQVFSELLDQRQDYFIDNFLSFFEDQILIKHVELNDKVIQSFLPNNLLECGVDYTQKKQTFKHYGIKNEQINSFDSILKRPFLETLLFSFYFANDGELEDKIMGLIRRSVLQKQEFYNNIEKLEILFSHDTQQAEYKIFIYTNSLQKQVQVSQSWLDIQNETEQIHKLNDIIRKLINLENLIKNDAQYNLDKLKTKQTIFLHKGTHKIIFQLLEKLMLYVQQNKNSFQQAHLSNNDNLLQKEFDNYSKYQFQTNTDKQEKIIQIFKICFSILQKLSFQSPANQQMIFKLFFKQCQQFNYVNLGQIELMCSLLQDNYELSIQVQKEDLQFFINMIREHGKRVEFLQIFDIILNNSELKSQSTILQKKVLEILLGDADQRIIEQINPFSPGQYKHTNFFSESQNLDQYKALFTIIISKALKTDLEVNMIVKICKFLRIKDLLQYLLIKKKNSKIDKEKNNNNNVEVRQNLCEIMLLFFSKNIRDSFMDFLSYSSLFSEYLDIQKQEIERDKEIPEEEKIFILDELVPLVNFFSYNIQKEFNSMNQQKQQAFNLKIKLQEFSEIFLRNLELMNIDSQTYIVDNEYRMKNIKNLCKISEIQNVPKFLKAKGKEKEENSQNFQIKSNSEIQDEEENYYFSQEVEFNENDNYLNIFQKEQKIKQGGRKLQNQNKGQFQGEDQQRQQDQLHRQEYWESFKEKLSQNEYLKVQIKDETKTLANSILNFKNAFIYDQSKQSQKDLLINTEDLILKLLTFIEFWKPKNISKQNVIFSLQTLIQLLIDPENEEQENNMNGEFIENDFDLTERQNMICKLNGTKIVLILMWEDEENDSEFLYYLFEFLIMQLEGGNQNVQNTCYDFFLTSSSCERFFEKINYILSLQISSLQAGQSKILDGKKQDHITLKLLRLLQLFCEGHNNNLQNYLRNQTNSKKPIDLINKVVLLLSSYKISNKTYETISQCFDTLTEFIQGPCLENQKSIVNSKFLDYAVQVLDESDRIFEQQIILKDVQYRDIEQRRQNINLHRGHMGRLKYKCLITLVSLMECNDPQTQLMKKIMRVVPLRILTDNLQRIYELYKKFPVQGGYVKELFDRAGTEDYEITEIDSNSNSNYKFNDGDIQKNSNNLKQFSQQKSQKISQNSENMSKNNFSKVNQEIKVDNRIMNEEYHELIIENGFLIYTLVNLYLENYKIDQQEEEDDEMNEYLNEFKREQEEKGLFGKDNIFGQLVSLGDGLVQAGLSTVNKMKEKITSQQSKEEMQQILNEQKKKDTKEAIKFFKENSVQIEIVRDQKLNTITFPLLPYCKQLKQDVKNDFNENVTRTSTKSKLEYLMKHSEQIIKKMKHEERLRRLYFKNCILGLLAKNIKLWENLAFWTAFAINFIILVSYYQDNNLIEQEADEKGIAENDSNGEQTDAYKDIIEFYRKNEPRLFFKSKYDAEPVIITLGYITIVFLAIVLAFFLLKKAPLLIEEIWKDFWKAEMGIFKRGILILVKFIKSVFVLLLNFDILYNLVYMALIIMGIVIHPFLFVATMADLLRTEDLKNVVKAAYNPRTELGLSFILFLVIEYYFTIFAYIFYNEEYPEEFCEKLWKCYIKTFDYTFKETGAIGSFLNDSNDPTAFSDDYVGINQDKTGLYISRWIFDNLFNITLVLIIINIVGGIIIDTFRGLREDSTERKKDQQQQCFICGISRETLDKSSDGEQGYYYHIKQVHYMWNYIHYKAFLLEKEQTEYNGNESYIWQKIQNNDLRWFPIKRTKSVQTDDEDKKKTKTQEVIKQYRNFNTRIEDIGGKIEKLQHIYN